MPKVVKCYMCQEEFDPRDKSGVDHMADMCVACDTLVDLFITMRHTPRVKMLEYLSDAHAELNRGGDIEKPSPVPHKIGPITNEEHKKFLRTLKQSFPRHFEKEKK